MAIWFLLPKRLSYCLWFLSPANRGADETNLLGSLSWYAQWVVRDYHVALWSALVVSGCILICLLTWSQMRRGGLVILLFVILAALLTINHPNRKSRYLHSWIAGIWVVAGVGLGHAVSQVRFSRKKSLQPLLAGTGLAVLATLQVPFVLEGGHAPAGGPQWERSSFLALTDCYLPHLENSKRSAVFSNQPIKGLVWWTFLERYSDLRRPEIDFEDYVDSRNKEAHFRNWLQTTRCDTVVYVYIPPGSYFFEYKEYPGHEQLREMLRSQQKFRLVNHWNHAGLKRAEITVWTRNGEN